VWKKAGCPQVCHRDVKDSPQVPLIGLHTLAEECLVGKKYIPSIERTRPTTLELTIAIQPKTTVRIHLPFNKAFIRYTEHPPDASRGFDLPPAILYLQDLADTLSEETSSQRPPAALWQRQKLRIYSSKLLLDLATPDFSMPYNVIIMTSTLLALFFGSVFNALTRRFGVVQVDPLPKKA
jgi:phosphatidylinositol glycan class T